jgi:hypothetical protein
MDDKLILPNPEQITYQTAVLQIGPATFRIVITASNGQYVGDMEFTTVRPDGATIMAKAFLQFAATQAQQLVRATNLPIGTLAS